MKITKQEKTQEILTEKDWRIIEDMHQSWIVTKALEKGLSQKVIKKMLENPDYLNEIFFANVGNILDFYLKGDITEDQLYFIVSNYSPKQVRLIELLLYLHFPINFILKHLSHTLNYDEMNDMRQKLIAIVAQKAYDEIKDNLELLGKVTDFLRQEDKFTLYFETSLKYKVLPEVLAVANIVYNRLDKNIETLFIKHALNLN